MKRRVIALVVAASLACGVPAVETQVNELREELLPGDNRRACAEWVERVNGESCLRVTYDESNLCRGVDGIEVDLTPWFRCLMEHTACDGSESRSDWGACEPPLVALDTVSG